MRGRTRCLPGTFPGMQAPAPADLTQRHRSGPLRRPGGRALAGAGERPPGRARRVLALLRIGAIVGGGAVLLRVIAGVGFANYDTLYALTWGRQLAHGQDPQYAIPIAPTPHPLMEALGVLTGPLGPHPAEQVAVWVGYVALAACGYLIYRIGATWFNRPAGLIAAAILLTRTPILSYGARAYIDLPFLALMLGALLIESRRARAGAPVLALLALAGLLRPEAWVFAGGYWLYLALWGRVAIGRAGMHLQIRRVATAEEPSDAISARSRGAGDSERTAGRTTRSWRALAGLLALVCAAPAIWVLSDFLVTGNAMWSLTHTRETATTLDRATGLLNVPEYVPRRIGEILRPAELAGAALGGILTLVYLPRRAAIGAAVGVIAVLVTAALATFGLPIDTRYVFLEAAILCAFCAACLCGWALLAPGHRARRAWAAVGALIALAMVASIPGQYEEAHHQLANLSRQEAIQNELIALARRSAIDPRCGPVGVPNHAPIPLLALYMGTRPGRIVSAQIRPIARGTYVEAASARVRREYILDPHEPHPLVPRLPAGFSYYTRNRDWIVYRRCSG